MNNQIREKLAKVSELANRGVEGEKEAAQSMLKKLQKKYNLSDEDLAKIKLQKYAFKYKTNIDLMLFQQLLKYFFKGRHFTIYQNTYQKRELSVELEYLDWVTMDSAYEYFRRHAAAQFKTFCLPHIRRCRTNKTRNAKRETLQDAFFSKYVIASKIYHPEQLKSTRIGDMTPKEQEAFRTKEAILGKVEGGQYHTQVGKETKMIG